MNKILIYAEQRQGSFKKVAYEMIAAAKTLQAQEIVAVVCGSSLDFCEELSNFGINKTIALEDPLFEFPTPDGYAKAIAQEAKSLNPDAILFAHSAMGKDLAPRVAAILDASCVTDATHLSLESQKITVTRFANSGKTVKTIQVNAQPCVITVRPNAYPLAEKTDGPGNFEKKSLGLSEDSIKVKVTEIIKTSDKVDLTEADKIVSGGRGLKGPENFNLIEELAETLGATVGASRAVVDAGWRPHSEQVGQTGKTVSPSLYVAVAISGAIQHLAGMSSSKVIVAINTDKEAPIFKIADYGIVGDAFEVVPEFIKALNENS